MCFYLLGLLIIVWPKIASLPNFQSFSKKYYSVLFVTILLVGYRLISIVKNRGMYVHKTGKWYVLLLRYLALTVLLLSVSAYILLLVALIVEFNEQAISIVYWLPSVFIGLLAYEASRLFSLEYEAMNT